MASPLLILMLVTQFELCQIITFAKGFEKRKNSRNWIKSNYNKLWHHRVNDVVIAQIVFYKNLIKDKVK